MKSSSSWYAPLAAAAVAAVLLGSAFVVVGGESGRPRASSPNLSDYLGFGHDPEADEARFARDERSRQEAIQECMNADGFIYVPAPPDIVVTPDMSDAELDLLIAEGSRDANGEYAKSLRPEDREQFFTTLYGVGGNSEGLSKAAMAAYDINGDGALAGQENWSRGCLGEASRLVPGVFYAAQLLTDELEALRKELEGTAAYLAAESDWVQCMGEAGFPGESRANVFEAQNAQNAVPDEAQMAGFASAEQDCRSSLDSADVQAARERLRQSLVEKNTDTLEEWGIRSD